MNKIFLILSLLVCVFSSAQVDTIAPPYKRFPSFPPVKLLKPDSATYFTKDDLSKKSAVMLMMFNPQCDHCQLETEELIAHIAEFKNIQIVMATTMPFDSMMAFREKYKLANYDNIVVAQDTKVFLPAFYMMRSLPYLAFYNRKKQLISVFEGSLPIARILEIFNN